VSLLLLLRRREITASGIVSAEVVGSPSLSSVIAALGILPGEGTGAIVASLDLELTGIVSGEVFGGVAIGLKSASVPGVEYVGGGGYAPSRQTAPHRYDAPLPLPLEMSARGIKSAETVGSCSIGFGVVAKSIQTREAVGTVEIIIPAQVLIMKKRYEHDEITALLMAA
jgi:hypothetical protein